MDVDLPVVIMSALDAVASGDTEQFLKCFQAEGSVDDWGRVFRGHNAIRRWSDKEFIGVNATLRVLSSTTLQGVTVVDAEVGGSGFNGTSHFTFNVNHGIIDAMTITA